MMSSFKANGLGTISLGNGRYYIGPFINGKFDTTGKDEVNLRKKKENCTLQDVHFELQVARPLEFT